MTIEKVYHWSLSTNRKPILQNGLQILVPQDQYVNPMTEEIEVWEPPYICTSLDPYTALRYLVSRFDGDMTEYSLDLYEVTLNSNDRIKTRCDGRNVIIEIRIENSIPVDRVRYIATREM